MSEFNYLIPVLEHNPGKYPIMVILLWKKQTEDFRGDIQCTRGAYCLGVGTDQHFSVVCKHNLIYKVIEGLSRG